MTNNDHHSNDHYTKAARNLHLGYFLTMLLICGFTPYFWFGVVPINSDRTEAAVYTSIEVSPALPEDALEREVLLHEFKWCRYCHVMQPGHPHEPGPELYKVFGRRAATVPGFYYSEVFLQAGRDGLIWTEQTIDEFITDPQAYNPGNRMLHGPVAIADPERRKRVINLLKKWTAEGSTLGKPATNAIPNKRDGREH